MNTRVEQISDKKVAIVCDWISDWGGAEIVLEQLLELFPNAEVFSSVFWQHDNPLFKNRVVHTSFIQNIPLLNKKHKFAGIFRPQAFESFNLSDYDIVISSSSAESKGVITKPDTLHLCYCHTPTRYFWSHYHEYRDMMEFGILNPLIRWLMPKIIHSLRSWDFCAAQRPDLFIANSENTRARVSKYYNRDSEVIYPCINLNKFKLQEQKSDYYFYIGRCIPYKKFDLIVDTFNKNGKNCIIVTNTDNKLYRQLKSRSKENIEWKLNISNQEKNHLFGTAKAFLFPPEEDFGIVPIEAMSTGTPVIAYEKGGALETVTDDTGVFFKEQTPESLNKAIEQFETIKFDSKKIRAHAEKFDKDIFKTQLTEFILKNIKKR